MYKPIKMQKKRGWNFSKMEIYLYFKKILKSDFKHMHEKN